MSEYKNNKIPSFKVSLLPIVLLLGVIVSIIVIKGVDVAQSISHFILLGVAVITAFIAKVFYACPLQNLWIGLQKSAKQILPAVVILVFIATVSSTWMLSGVVPTFINYGLELLNLNLFLFITCAVCSFISVLSGSSWTTIATIGVAFMGIGTVFGYNEGWIAGAIISGAYFGDKVSPLSDTTVLASSSCGVELFKHIKYLMQTTIPAMGIALIVFAIVGFCNSSLEVEHSLQMVEVIEKSFNITNWVLLIPLITCIFIFFRINTTITLAISSLLGCIGIFIFQPQVINNLGGVSGDLFSQIKVIIGILFTETQLSTGDDLLDSLVYTGGVQGMLPTIYLVLCAMLFGGMMLGSGMITSITNTFTRRIHTPRATVGATVGSGLFLNSCTGDQYLSIIIGGNIFKNLYRKNGLEERLLSRSLEDSISVTSVLIPWNSCGVTQATVLGVATLTYLPYCIFNYLSPIMSLVFVYIGYKIVQIKK